MSQFVFIQFPLESERSTTYVTVELVRVLAVLRSLVLHPSSIAGKYGSALPSAGVGLYPSVAVQVSLHVAVDEESFATNVAGVPHVPGVLPEVLLQMLLLPVLPPAAGELTFEPEVAGLHLLELPPDPLPVTGVNMLPQVLARLKSQSAGFVYTDVRFRIVMDNFQMAIHVVRPALIMIMM